MYTVYTKLDDNNTIRIQLKNYIFCKNFVKVANLVNIKGCCFKNMIICVMNEIHFSVYWRRY